MSGGDYLFTLTFSVSKSNFQIYLLRAYPWNSKSLDRWISQLTPYDLGCRYSSHTRSPPIKRGNSKLLPKKLPLGFRKPSNENHDQKVIFECQHHQETDMSFLVAWYESFWGVARNDARQQYNKNSQPSRVAQCIFVDIQSYLTCQSSATICP